MIQFSCLHNGGTDLPIVQSPDDRFISYPTANMADVHESFQRTALQQIDQAVLAEKLGFDFFFLTEHHFQPEGTEFSPAPLQVGAAIAARTSTIRIGQLANIVTRHHPLTLAEQGAMLDVISGGRLEFGIGTGAGTRETEPFGQVYGSSDTDAFRRSRYFRETVEIILKAWTEPSFSYHGSFFSIPPKWTAWPSALTRAYFAQPHVERDVSDIVENHGGQWSLKEISVFPQPLQKPHPQIWQVARSIESCRAAARMGFNICHPAATVAQLDELVDAYYTEAEKAGWPDRVQPGVPFKYGWDAKRKRGVTLLRRVFIGDPTAAERVGMSHFANYIVQALIPGVHSPAGRQLTPDDMQGDGLVIIGSADEVCERLLSDYHAGHFEDYLVVPRFEFAGHTAAATEAQMHAFAEEVMPVLERECGGREPAMEPVGLETD
jgi:alkanesulfonate monooxygenase SsuD/methylene tetrahydromethanopterin reductase-like flavin-dependent oxidoreductase (luciferase family)